MFFIVQSHHIEWLGVAQNSFVLVLDKIFGLAFFVVVGKISDCGARRAACERCGYPLSPLRQVANVRRRMTPIETSSNYHLVHEAYSARLITWARHDGERRCDPVRTLSIRI